MMGDPVTVVIEAPPVPKARPRMTRLGRVYTEARTLRFESLVRRAAKDAMANRHPIIGPVRAELLFELAIPASWNAKQKAAATVGDILPASRPDLDNFCKAVFDGLNEIVFRDDAQVVQVKARKIYGLAPKTVATIRPLAVPPPPVPVRRKLDPVIEQKLFGPAPFASGLPDRRR